VRRGEKMTRVKILRIARIVIAIFFVVFGVILFLGEKSLAGLWFLPMVVVLFFLMWGPYSSGKRKS